MTRKRLLQSVTWLVTAAVVGYIGATTDLPAVAHTLRALNGPGLAAVVAVTCFVMLWIDSACLALLFSRFDAPTGFREIVPVKGASYVLNTLNYNAGAAATALYFRNRKGVPLIRALGTMLWLNAVDLVALTLLMLVGMAVGHGTLGSSERRTLLLFAGAVLVAFAGSCVYWNAGFDWLILGPLRHWRIFGAFRAARLRDYALFIGLRMVFGCTYTLSQWAFMPFFGMRASLLPLLLYVPVLTFVATIPFTTVSGLGTVQVLMRHYYLELAPMGLAQVDAFSTVTIVGVALGRLLIGLWFTRTVAREMGPGPAQTTEPKP